MSGLPNSDRPPRSSRMAPEDGTMRQVLEIGPPDRAGLSSGITRAPGPRRRTSEGVTLAIWRSLDIATACFPAWKR